MVFLIRISLNFAFSKCCIGRKTTSKISGYNFCQLPSWAKIFYRCNTQAVEICLSLKYFVFLEYWLTLHCNYVFKKCKYGLKLFQLNVCSNFQLFLGFKSFKRDIKWVTLYPFTTKITRCMEFWPPFWQFLFSLWNIVCNGRRHQKYFRL